jgi:YXWGXW repeat-containing protein
MKKVSIISLIFTVFILASCSTSAHTVSHNPPSKTTIVVKSSRPGNNYVWVDGYWKWSNRKHKYVWVNGYWAKKRNGRVWIPNHYQKKHGTYVYVPGHWR